MDLRNGSNTLVSSQKRKLPPAQAKPRKKLYKNKSGNPRRHGPGTIRESKKNSVTFDHKALSNDLWLSVFDHLGYTELKICSRVNKNFRALTDRTSFDKTLFRKADIVTDHVVVNFHPVIYQLCGCGHDDLPRNHHGYLEGTPPNQTVEHGHLLCHHTIESSEFLPLAMSAQDEYLTEPAICRLRAALRHNLRKTVMVECATGVTVKQLWQALMQWDEETRAAEYGEDDDIEDDIPTKLTRLKEVIWTGGWWMAMTCDDPTCAGMNGQCDSPADPQKSGLTVWML